MSKLETQIANYFVVEVVNEGGCSVPGLGDSFENLDVALKAARRITRHQCQKAGAVVQITAVDDIETVYADGVDGGMIIWRKFV